MKNKLLLQIITAVTVISLPTINLAQAPSLGSASAFVLFSSNGAVGNTGISHITGNVGTNSGASTAFGNVNGSMHDNDGASAAASAALLNAYNDLNSAVATFFPAPLLGNDATLNAGVYSISANTTLNDTLTLDAQGNPNAVFIFKIQAPFSTNAASFVNLVNGAQSCKVFWKVEGMVSMASGTSMKGTIIANNAAIDMSSGVILEGRALTTAGAVTVNGVKLNVPSGCGSPVLTGPTAPVLASAGCYAILSGNGPVTNSGITTVTGDVGTNVGLTTGYNPALVNGTLHPVPDGSTAAAAADLLNAYTYLNTLSDDIELLYPAQFGNSLVLTPHTYIMNGAVSFTDTVFLNAEGNVNAVFVIQVNGALATSTYSNVALINGTQASNVFWKIEGSVDINDYSEFKGTIICNNGAVSLYSGVDLDGRALTTNGAINTNAVAVVSPQNCSVTGLQDQSGKTAKASFYPNPFTASLVVSIDNAAAANGSVLSLFNSKGIEVQSQVLLQAVTTLDLDLPAGVYFYKITDKSGAVQSGKLVSNK
jgi:hypothetical protein